MLLFDIFEEGIFYHFRLTCVQIVDEERTHLALLDDVSSLTVPLPDQLGGLSSVPGLQLSSGHHDGAAKRFKEDDSSKGSGNLKRIMLGIKFKDILTRNTNRVCRERYDL
jgi:hypothetical protein